MSVKAAAMIKKLIRLPFNAMGLELIRKSAKPSWKERMQLAKEIGLSPKVVFDGGAFWGLWAREIAKIFPGIQLVLLEPNPFVLEILENNVSDILPKPIIMDVALGESEGKATLKMWHDEKSDVGASLLDHVRGQARREVPVKVDTLDNICKELSLVPDLLKLDLQGGELLALKGGSEVLRDAEFAIIEFGCLEAYEGRATPRDIIEIMYDNNYCLYDIVDCGYRPYDGALRGGDFFFVKNSSVLRGYKGFE